MINVFDQIIAEMDPQQLGQLVAEVTNPEEFIRRGLNQPREVGNAGNVRVPMSQMPQGIYGSPRPPQR